MARAESFQKGKTSRADIIAALGTPASTGHTSSGSSITYTYSKTQTGGLKNVAAAYGIGTFHSAMAVKTCVYTFDERDKLSDMQCTESGQ